jgi:hypothetical protein
MAPRHLDQRIHTLVRDFGQVNAKPRELRGVAPDFFVRVRLRGHEALRLPFGETRRLKRRERSLIRVRRSLLTVPTGRKSSWTARWLAEIEAVIAAVTLADFLVAALVAHVDLVTLVALGIVAFGLTSVAIGLFWSRRIRTVRSRTISA